MAKLLVLCAVLTASNCIPVQNLNVDLRTEMALHGGLPSNKKSENHFIKNELDKAEKNNLNGKDIIDKFLFDENPYLMELLGSFQVYDENKKIKGQFRHKENKKVKAQNLDHHRTVPGNASPSKRNFGNFSATWEKGIVPYELDSSLNENVQETILKAIDLFNNYTCIRLMPFSDVQAASLVGHSSKIVFKDDVSGCWSYIGYTGYSEQGIGLEFPGCNDVLTVVHEIMHALGLYHEQSRTDRDKYVSINTENLMAGVSINMEKTDTTDQHSYDLESIMQYGLKAFSKNGLPTITLKDPSFEFLVDSADGLTFYDIADITSAYRGTCEDKCNGTPPVCQNGGFVAWDCKCFCPFDSTSSVCETITTDSGCGGTIHLTAGEIRDIKSPNYPSNYNSNQICQWLIKGPVDSHLKLTVVSLDISRSGDNCYHWLEVQRNIPGQSGKKYCGNMSNQTTTNEKTKNMMILKFDTKFASTAATDTGFHVKVEAVVGTTATSTSTTNSASTTDPASTTSSTSTTTPTVPSSDISCSYEPGQQTLYSHRTNLDLEMNSQNAHDGNYYLISKAGYCSFENFNRALSSSKQHCLEIYFQFSGDGYIGIYGTSVVQLSQVNDWYKMTAEFSAGVIPGTLYGSMTIQFIFDSIAVKEGSCT